MEAGFYKFDGTLLYGRFWIKNANYELLVENKDTYNYPIDGWYWFDSLEEACLHFNLNIADYMPKEE